MCTHVLILILESFINIRLSLIHVLYSVYTSDTLPADSQHDLPSYESYQYLRAIQRPVSVTVLALCGGNLL